MSKEDNTATKDWIELARITQESIHDRRKYEWSNMLTLWTAVYAFTLAVHTNKIKLPLSTFVIVFLYIASFVSIVLFWILPNHQANAGDKIFLKYFKDNARRKLLGDELEKGPEGSRVCFNEFTNCQVNGAVAGECPFSNFSNWSCVNILWFIGKVILTGILLAVSCWLVILSPCYLIRKCP